MGVNSETREPSGARRRPVAYAACYVPAVWGVVLLVVFAAACGRAAERPSLTLTVGDTVTVSGGRESDRVDVSFTPALAVGPTGKVVVWATERRDYESGAHITARRLSADTVPLGDPIELGRGWSPEVVAGFDAFVVTWRPPPDSGASFAFAEVGDNPATPIVPTLVGDDSTVGPAEVTTSAGAVFASSCADDADHLVIARDALGAPRVERVRMLSGCDGVQAVSTPGGAFAVVVTNELRTTAVVALTEPTATTRSFVSGLCEGVRKGSEVVFVCLDKHDGHVVDLRTGIFRLNRVDIEFGGFVYDLHAGWLEQGILLAWTTETPGGFALHAAMVRPDGRALSPTVDLSDEPVGAWFGLAGDGAAAWVVHIKEIQVEAKLYRHDVVLVPIRVAGTGLR